MRLTHSFNRTARSRVLNGSEVPSAPPVKLGVRQNKTGVITMRQFVIETRVKKGHLELNNVPFSDETEVKIVVIPKVNLTKMSFPEIRKLTESQNS